MTHNAVLMLNIHKQPNDQVFSSCNMNLPPEEIGRTIRKVVVKNFFSFPFVGIMMSLVSLKIQLDS